MSKWFTMIYADALKRLGALGFDDVVIDAIVNNNTGKPLRSGCQVELQSTASSLESGQQVGNATMAVTEAHCERRFSFRTEVDGATVRTVYVVEHTTSKQRALEMSET